MQYLLLIYGNEAMMASVPQDATTKMSAAYMAYTEAMSKAGVLLGGNRLRPSYNGTSVRTVDGKNHVLVVRSRQKHPCCRVNRPTKTRASGKIRRLFPSDFIH